MRRPAPVSIPHLVAAGLVMAGVGGCQLIDQRTFERRGAAPSATDLAHSGDLAHQRIIGTARPLISVRPGDLGVDWRPDVLAAVRDALVHDPNAAFDIVTSFPTALGESSQQSALATGAADAASVAGVIQADGVPAERLHIGARGDAGHPARDVTVWLR